MEDYMWPAIITITFGLIAISGVSLDSKISYLEERLHQKEIFFADKIGDLDSRLDGVVETFLRQSK